MPQVALTLGESKNAVALSLESKGDTNITWDQAIWTWDEAGGTWDNPVPLLTKESKTTGALTLEAK